MNEQRIKEFEAVLKYYGFFEPLNQYKIICPFHGDKNPSMLINLDEGKFFCFGCEAHGDAFEFVKLYHPEFNTFQIVQEIQRACRGSKGKQKLAIQQVERKQLNMSAVRDYYYNLPEINWLSNSVDQESKRYMKKRGFKMQTLNKVGARINLTDSYKIVFPIMDNGVFRGYVGRTTDVRIEQQRKYIYNTGFRRSKTLAGVYSASSVLVVEGYMDMLKACQNGVRSVVAILGWKMSQQQQNKLKRKGIITIVCGLDNDEAGNKGYKYLRSLKDFNVVRLHYPKGIKDFGDVNEDIFNSRIKSQLAKYNLI